MEPFEVKDCALLMRMSGLPPAMNLRELRDRIAVCEEDVLYHHFCETTLRPMSAAARENVSSTSSRRGERNAPCGSPSG